MIRDSIASWKMKTVKKSSMQELQVAEKIVTSYKSFFFLHLS